MSKNKIDTCYKCGGSLEPGYLLGKQNRIRWSTSKKGMTIFHGVPLIKLEKGFWRRLHWWKYAPSIAAKRCKNCRLVIFTYNNDQQENPSRERNISKFITLLLISLAIVLTISAYILIMQTQPIPLFLIFMIGAFAFLIFLLGLAFYFETLEK